MARAQPRGGQPGRQPVDGHDPPGVEDLVVALDRLELGVVEGQLPAEPLDPARDHDLAGRPGAAARCSAGRTRSPRSSRSRRSGRRSCAGPGAGTTARTRTSATRTRAETTVPVLHQAEVAEPAHLAQVVVAAGQVEQQVADVVDAEPDAGPPQGGRRPPARTRQRRVEQLDRVGRRGGGAGLVAGSSAPLLRRDQVPVVGLAAVADLHLDPGHRRADALRQPLGLGEVGAVAVEDREELVAGVERADRREDRLRPVAVDRDEPVVRVERDRLAALDLLAADRRVADGLGDDELWIARAASVIGPRSPRRSSVGSRASSAANPSAAFRVATTATGRSASAATCRAARTTLGLLGRIRTSRASTADDRLEQLAGARVRRSARPARWRPRRSRGRSRPGRRRQTTAITPRAASASAGAAAGRRAAAPAPSGPPAARAGERRGPRLADVARLVVEVLDADPAERAERQAVADDQVRPLVVDVDLERPRVAGDQHRLADRLEVDPDRVDVERARAVGLQQEHRLVAEPLVGVGDQRRRLGAAPWPRLRAAAAGACPTRWRSAPWNRRYRPCPPESTTPASRRIARSVGVRATDFSAASTVAASTVSRSSLCSAAATAASADSRMTVRIVPSTGLATAA